MIERYEHRPYGRRLRFDASGVSLDPLMSQVHAGFTGHEQEQDIGAVDMGGRFYNLTTGSFLSPDPVIHSATNRGDFNAYRYGADNPIRFTDPSGFDYCDHACGDASSWIGVIVNAIVGLFGGSSGGGNFRFTGVGSWRFVVHLPATCTRTSASPGAGRGQGKRRARGHLRSRGTPVIQPTRRLRRLRSRWNGYRNGARRACSARPCVS